MISKPPPKEVPAEPVLDKHSTEACANAALDPSVSEAEEAEYQGWDKYVFLIVVHRRLWFVSSLSLFRRFFLNRYIDQFQELLDAPATLGERKDLEVYAQAVQTGKRDSVDCWLEDIPKDFVTYVERSSTQYLDEGKKQAFPVTFNYERWLGSV